jgi:uncharacterized protein DUF1488
MTPVSREAAAPRPRWDGSRILFEVSDGTAQIACAISREALQDISGTRCFKEADLLRCFADARERIEALALQKLRAAPGNVASRVNLWAGDVDNPPTGRLATSS